jgi:hypothetical protein
MTIMQTIEDFEVRIAGEDRVVVFASVARGELARFPAWERADRDLRHFVLDDIPTGSRAEPFVDADEGWRITIFESGGHVYVHENDGEGFRVPRDAYFAAWEKLIARYNPAIPLDELFTEET